MESAELVELRAWPGKGVSSHHEDEGKHWGESLHGVWEQLVIKNANSDHNNNSTTRSDQLENVDPVFLVNSAL